MATRFLVPFDNKPVSNGTSSTTYTVPAGKYARVSVQYSVSAWGYVSAYGSNYAASTYPPTQNNTSTCDSGRIEFWANPGDVITYVATAASATASTTQVQTASNRYIADCQGQSRVYVTVNGNVIGDYYSPATAHYSFVAASTINNSSAIATTVVTGTATCKMFYDEHTVLT